VLAVGSSIAQDGFSVPRIVRVNEGLRCFFLGGKTVYMSILYRAGCIESDACAGSMYLQGLGDDFAVQVYVDVYAGRCIVEVCERFSGYDDGQD
jgi:hypothetical protein